MKLGWTCVAILAAFGCSDGSVDTMGGLLPERFAHLADGGLIETDAAAADSMTNGTSDPPADGGPAPAAPGSPDTPDSSAGERHPGRAFIRVDPKRGADDAAGTEAQPVATLQRGLDLAAGYRSNGHPVTIELAEGVHWLSEPAIVSGAHSGTEALPLVITSEAKDGVPTTASLAGGLPLLGEWQMVPGTPLYRIATRPGHVFRQLFVNGVRKPRARTPLFPDGGLRTTEEVNRCLPLESGVEPAGYRLDRYRVRVERPTELELVSLENWRMFRCPVTDVSADGSFLSLDNLCWERSARDPRFGIGRLAWLENAREFVDSPGEWYLDSRENYLYYYPESVDQVSAAPASFIAPLAEGLLWFRGEPRNPVRHVRIDHVDIAFTSWLGPNGGGGYSPVQAGVHFEACSTCPSGYRAITVPGAIDLRYAEDVTITNGVFHRLGGSGVNLGEGTKRCLVVNNVMMDFSASGVVIGRTFRPRTAGAFDVTRAIEGHRVVDNEIRRIGLEYYDSVGVFLGYVRDVTVRRNTILDVPYTGISVGWGWSDEEIDSLRDNLIIANVIRRSMRKLIDGAGVYTLSRQPGTEVLNNFIDGIGVGLRVGERWAVQRCRNTPSVPLYLDTGSAAMRIVNNVYRGVAFDALVSSRPPLHGTQVPSPRTSCGFKACDIEALYNRPYRPGNEHDELIVQNAGRR